MSDLANFVASTHQGLITIRRSEGDFQIDLSPGEADKATKVVGLALSMIEWNTVPPHIFNTPFVVRFFPNQAFALERTDVKGSIPFRIREGDELIKVIQMGLGICLNEQTHGRVVPSMAPAMPHMVGDEPL